jgi:dolichol-phosphate mannosyltransferase
MFAWIGYRQTAVHYEREARHAGHTKFSGRRMIGFAADGVVSFSAAPLRAVLSGGFVVSILSVLSGVTAVILKITGTYTVPGWASIAVGIALLGGIQLTVLGVIGEYVARIHEEVKRRPLYFVSDSTGVSQPDEAGARPDS